MAPVARQARVRDPGDILIRLEPVRQLQRVRRVPLAAQAERLDAQQELLRGEGVQGCAEVALDFYARAHDEGLRAEGRPELESVVAFAGLVELREACGVGAPVELAAVDYHAADGRAVAWRGY